MKKQKVLVVDDIIFNRDLLNDFLEDIYDVILAENGIDALKIIDEQKNEIAIVLLDIVMPELDGFGVLEELKKRGLLETLPIIMISGDDSYESEKKCFEYGVMNFIHKPFSGSDVQLQVKNAIELFNYRLNLEQRVFEQNKILQVQNERLQKINDKIVELLGMVVEYRDADSGSHVNRIKTYTNIFAKELQNSYPEYNLDDEKVELMSLASVLHDLGKIAVPDNVLLKPGRLTPEEYEIIKTHTVKGSEMVERMRDTWDDDFYYMCYNIARHHHERYDGTGYPDGLVGENIPIEAQIVAVADVYDALVTKRPYKEPFSCDEAYRMIINGECGTFSPKIMDCFTKAKPKFDEISKES